jgi:hypothetical protein
MRSSPAKIGVEWREVANHAHALERDRSQRLDVAEGQVVEVHAHGSALYRRDGRRGRPPAQEVWAQLRDRLIGIGDTRGNDFGGGQNVARWSRSQREGFAICARATRCASRQ